jgi:hypothetical protein
MRVLGRRRRLPRQARRLVGPAESQEFGHRNKYAEPMLRLLICFSPIRLVQNPITDGEHLRGLRWTDKQPLFGWDRGVADAR